MRFLLCLLAIPAFAQITVQVSPEPMVITKTLYGTTAMGTWSVIACNDTSAVVLLPAERIALAFPQVPIIDPTRALQVLDMARGKRWQLRLANYAEIGLSLATGLMGAGVITASGKVITSLAIAGPVAHSVGDTWRSRYPQFDQSKLLQGMISLAPNACERRTAFSAKIKTPKVASAVLRAPNQ